ncbi:Oligoketide cyclase/lipid transport protein [Candidatus Endolissoclinum faulkneri L5]|uniref:Oligoketide cyclase/lipid transport protein n=1 Tax=Candidatus Endolissoclinum faulkneri L5 TaxID=1401328 RepID=V9TWC8_9PROT|nr:type II toxin-antitoxin system RatA family toxin [Candidatus Endolissoclinum faulkneri]AHC73630.1 Oligoketide cyclase/lipid transport protein [Candidatus Endolissoclinum faulkneri L5]
MPLHSEKRVVYYLPEQMYALVADVESYPDFLPWCAGARINKRYDNIFFADLMIGYKLFREKFTSKVGLYPQENRIEVTYTDGPFLYLKNYWGFHKHGDYCLIDFYLDFEFKNIVIQRMMRLFFNEAVRRMVQAFEDRAESLYGASSIFKSASCSSKHF